MADSVVQEFSVLGAESIAVGSHLRIYDKCDMLLRRAREAVCITSSPLAELFYVEPKAPERVSRPRSNRVLAARPDASYGGYSPRARTSRY